MNVRLEAAWFQGVLFSLLYRQGADTIKNKEIVAIKHINRKNRIQQKNSKKTSHSTSHLTSARHCDV